MALFYHRTAHDDPLLHKTTLDIFLSLPQTLKHFYVYLGKWCSKGLLCTHSGACLTILCVSVQSFLFTTAQKKRYCSGLVTDIAKHSNQLWHFCDSALWRPSWDTDSSPDCFSWPVLRPCGTGGTPGSPTNAHLIELPRVKTQQRSRQWPDMTSGEQSTPVWSADLKPVCRQQCLCVALAHPVDRLALICVQYSRGEERRRRQKLGFIGSLEYDDVDTMQLTETPQNTHSFTHTTHEHRLKHTHTQTHQLVWACSVHCTMLNSKPHW